VGWNAGDLISTGYYNSLLGENSGSSLTIGGGNVAIGANAFPVAVDAYESVAIGTNSGANVTTGTCNVLIGPYVQAPNATGSCQLALGRGTTYWLTGCSTGAIRPGAGLMDCAGSTGSAGQILCSNGSNAIVWAAPAVGRAAWAQYVTCVDAQGWAIGGFLEQWTYVDGAGTVGIAIGSSSSGGTNNIISLPIDGLTYRVDVTGAAFVAGGLTTSVSNIDVSNGTGVNVGTRYPGFSVPNISGTVRGGSFASTGFIKPATNNCAIGLENVASFGTPGLFLQSYASQTAITISIVA
jgi:hypothetical protein